MSLGRSIWDKVKDGAKSVASSFKREYKITAASVTRNRSSEEMFRETIVSHIASSARSLTVPYTAGSGSSVNQVEDIVTGKTEGVGCYDMIGRNPATLCNVFHWLNITAGCMQVAAFSCINGTEDLCSKASAAFCSTVCPDAFSTFASALCCMEPCTEDRSRMLERNSCWVPVCSKGAVACLCCVSVKGVSSVVSYTLGAGLDENLLHPVHQSLAPPLQDMDASQTLKISHDLGSLSVDQKTVLMAGRGIRLNFPQVPAQSSVAPAPFERQRRVLSIDLNELKTERKYDAQPAAVSASPVSVLKPLGFAPAPGQVNMDDDFNGSDLMKSRTPSRLPSVSEIVPSPHAASVLSAPVPRLPLSPILEQLALSTFVNAYIPNNNDAEVHTTRVPVASSESKHKGLVSLPSSSAYSSSSLSQGSRGMLFVASKRPSIAVSSPAPASSQPANEQHEDRSTLRGFGLGFAPNT